MPYRVRKEEMERIVLSILNEIRYLLITLSIPFTPVRNCQMSNVEGI